jgi:DNA-binding CsgD family transcriptional regulator
MAHSTRKTTSRPANAGEVANAPQKRLGALTERRRQVETLACRGLSNRQIAEKLGVTEGTVKTHIHAIFEKLDVHNRAELIFALIGRSKSDKREKSAPTNWLTGANVLHCSDVRFGQKQTLPAEIAMSALPPFGVPTSNLASKRTDKR